MLRLQKMGSVTFDYGNNIRTFAFQRGVKNAYDFPGFVPAYIRPLFCEGRGPFRWVALSGEPSDIHVTDELVLELFPENRILRRTLIDIFEQSKKSRVAYADLVDQKVKTAHGQAVETTVTRDTTRRGRRHRRW